MRDADIKKIRTSWKLTCLFLFVIRGEATGGIDGDFSVHQNIPAASLLPFRDNQSPTIIRRSAVLQEVPDQSNNTYFNSTESTNDTTQPGDVCYDSVSCFSMQPPWRSEARPLPPPQPPAAIQTHFVLTFRGNPSGLLIYPGQNVSANDAGFVPGKFTFFIIHDLASNHYTPWMIDLKDALLEQVDSNVFLTDWGGGADGALSYLQVASNARVVGAQVARLLLHLVTTHNVSLPKVHLIGLGVGAHVAAYAGKRIKEIGRITALDPAQAAFEGGDRRVRLAQDDASFVEVLHSDARPALPFLGAGMLAATGDVDFYINGGINQPGCKVSPQEFLIKSLADFANISAQFVYSQGYCHHIRSVVVYIEAIRHPNCTFWGQPGAFVDPDPEEVVAGRPFSYVSSLFEECGAQNCAPLGLESLRYPARGTFVVRTRHRRSFCKANPELDEKMHEELKKFQSSSIKAPLGGRLPQPPSITSLPHSSSTSPSFSRISTRIPTPIELTSSVVKVKMSLPTTGPTFQCNSTRPHSASVASNPHRVSSLSTSPSPTPAMFPSTSKTQSSHLAQSPSPLHTPQLSILKPSEAPPIPKGLAVSAPVPSQSLLNSAPPLLMTLFPSTMIFTNAIPPSRLLGEPAQAIKFVNPPVIPQTHQETDEAVATESISTLWRPQTVAVLLQAYPSGSASQPVLAPNLSVQAPHSQFAYISSVSTNLSVVPLSEISSPQFLSNALLQSSPQNRSQLHASPPQPANQYEPRHTSQGTPQPMSQLAPERLPPSWFQPALQQAPQLAPPPAPLAGSEIASQFSGQSLSQLSSQPTPQPASQEVSQLAPAPAPQPAPQRGLQHAFQSAFQLKPQPMPQPQYQSAEVLSQSQYQSLSQFPAQSSPQSALLTPPLAPPQSTTPPIPSLSPLPLPPLQALPLPTPAPCSFPSQPPAAAPPKAPANASGWWKFVPRLKPP